MRSLGLYIVDAGVSKGKTKAKQPVHQAELIDPNPSQTVARVLRWYEKNGDALIGERLLNNINLSELQRLFDEPQDNLMFECCPFYGVAGNVAGNQIINAQQLSLTSAAIEIQSLLTQLAQDSLKDL